jgi:hypothetical protein
MKLTWLVLVVSLAVAALLTLAAPPPKKDTYKPAAEVRKIDRFIG